ncbi:MAG TPA: ATP-binding protein [Streptosporangiaceae bacterium]|nr:ATP-binding protein [Streptosporangiaceae bacterium]
MPAALNILPKLLDVAISTYLTELAKMRGSVDGTVGEPARPPTELAQAALAAQWQTRFEDLLADHPDAESDLAALVEELRRMVTSAADHSVIVPRRELAAILNYLRDPALRGVLLLGEPGTGKTTLLAMAAQELSRQGRPVFGVRLADVRHAGDLGARVLTAISASP